MDEHIHKKCVWILFGPLRRESNTSLSKLTIYDKLFVCVCCAIHARQCSVVSFFAFGEKCSPPLCSFCFKTEIRSVLLTYASLLYHCFVPFATYISTCKNVMTVRKEFVCLHACFCSWRYTSTGKRIKTHKNNCNSCHVHFLQTHFSSLIPFPSLIRAVSACQLFL